MRHQTVFVASPKGGVGKSTVSINLAAALATRRGQPRDVLLVDADPQMSTADWSDASDGKDRRFNVAAAPRPQLDKAMTSLVMPKDFLIIDGPGESASSVVTVAGVRLADLVLVPVSPSPFDIWSASTLLEMLQTRIAITDGALQAAFLITQARPRSVLARQTRIALAQAGLPVLETVITARKSYVESVAQGQTVFDTDDAAAHAEIDALAAEVLALLDACQKKHAA